MRLGQLARQLGNKPEEIVSFLKKEMNITIKTHPNTKIIDELITPIIAYFNSENKQQEISEEVTIEHIQIDKEKTVEEKETIKSDIQIEDEKPAHLETIKSPKIIGKIDLPDKSQIKVEVDGVVYDQEFLDKKKKEEQQAERERKIAEKEAKRKKEQEKKEKALAKRKIEAERQAMLENEKHTILSIEEEKERAIIEKSIQKREKRIEQQRKKKRKENYLKKHAVKKASSKSKAKIKKDAITEEVINIEPSVEVNEPIETNIFKRFLKWLNTE